jgi:hypothetical protein
MKRKHSPDRRYNNNRPRDNNYDRSNYNHQDVRQRVEYNRPQHDGVYYYPRHRHYPHYQDNGTSRTTRGAPYDYRPGEYRERRPSPPSISYKRSRYDNRHREVIQQKSPPNSRDDSEGHYLFRYGEIIKDQCKISFINCSYHK